MRDYAFYSSLGTDPTCMIETPIYAAIGVHSTVEVVVIKYDSDYIRAIDVGYCARYDSEVFFGDDGVIYLAKFDQMTEDTGDIKVFASYLALEAKWHTFSQ